MVKSRLIKYCLAIKNGLKVNSNELMQLLRRSYKLKLDEDPVMSGYLKVRDMYLFCVHCVMLFVCLFEVFSVCSVCPMRVFLVFVKSVQKVHIKIYCSSF